MRCCVLDEPGMVLFCSRMNAERLDISTLLAYNCVELEKVLVRRGLRVLLMRVVCMWTEVVLAKQR